MQIMETVEDINTAASSDCVPRTQDIDIPQLEPLDMQWLWAAGAAKAEQDLGRPANTRARVSLIAALVQSALFAALVRSLFGVNVLQQWNAPQVCQRNFPLCCHVWNM